MLALQMITTINNNCFLRSIILSVAGTAPMKCQQLAVSIESPYNKNRSSTLHRPSD